MRNVRKSDSNSNMASAPLISMADSRRSQAYPTLRTIIFVGCITLVACLSVLYMVDPSLTTEYAGHAVDMLSDFKDNLLGADDDSYDDDGAGAMLAKAELIANYSIAASLSKATAGSNGGGKSSSSGGSGRSSSSSSSRGNAASALVRNMTEIAELRAKQRDLIMKQLAAQKAVHEAEEMNYTGFSEQSVQHGGGYKEGMVQLADFGFIWRRPLAATGTPKGLVFLAHTCGRSPASWWPKSELCPVCSHLPLQERMTSLLGKEGFAVMAMAPVYTLNTTQCWHGRDRKYMAAAIKYVYKALGSSVQQVPLYALGTENGGFQLTNNARVFGSRFGLSFSAICVMNTGARVPSSSNNSSSSSDFPPTYFVDLAKNLYAVKANQANVEKLKAAGIDAVHRISQQRAVVHNFFISVMSEEQSRRFHQELIKHGFVGAQNNTLLKDPTRPKHHKELVEIGKKVAPDVVPAKDPIRGPASGLMQLLNIAWAMREVNDEFIFEIMEFFKNHRASGAVSAAVAAAGGAAASRRQLR